MLRKRVVADDFALWNVSVQTRKVQSFSVGVYWHLEVVSKYVVCLRCEEKESM